MKKVFLGLGLLAMSPLLDVANAGNIDREARKQQRKERREERRLEWSHSVNRITENQFFHDFPEAKNVSWTEGVFAEASFDDGALHKIAYYDMDNELVGTTFNVDYATLSEKAREQIEKNYAGYKVERVILFDDNESNDTDMYLFSHAFDDEDTYFAVLGNDSKEVILKITRDGRVSFFQDYK